MENKAIRILDVIDCHNSLDDLNEEARDGIISWITGILEDDLYTQDQVDETIKEKEEELKSNCVDHIKVLRNHLRNRMREVDKLERELMRMENRLRNKDNIIRELSEVIIKITNEEED